MIGGEQPQCGGIGADQFNRQMHNTIENDLDVERTADCARQIAQTTLTFQRLVRLGVQLCVLQRERNARCQGRQSTRMFRAEGIGGKTVNANEGDGLLTYNDWRAKP